MPDIGKVKEILFLLGLPAGTLIVFVICILVALEVYPKFRLFFGDILRLFGPSSRWVRKKSLECEMEGTINSFTKDFNRDLDTPLLPQCSIRWVKEDTPAAILEPGRAIVKVSFGEDHNVNLFYAAKAFVKASLIPRAKPFMRRPTADAVDLLVTRNLLRDSRREALTVFTTEFLSCPDECREQFHRLAETDNAGLFKRILLQELHFFAEAMGDKTPKPEYGDEADDFVTWLYDIAIREPEELSRLSFEGKNIRVGVILVAQSETYSRFGLEPYLRRARAYATKGFPCVYLLARGSRKNAVTRQLVDELCSDGCFECLTRQPATLVRGVINGDEVVVTCYCLRPVPFAIIQRAWTTCWTACEQKSEVTATVEGISDEGVDVEVYGLRATISNEHLSELDLRNGFRYFRRYDELSLRVLQCDEKRDILVLSNRGTETDPKRAVEAVNLPEGQNISAVIQRFVTKDGHEMGLAVSLGDCNFGGFVPRSEATRSRFIPLSDLYHVGEKVEVAISRFVPQHANFLCTMPGLPDPWAAGAPEVGHVVVGPTRLIRKSLVICEPEPGLEAWCPYEELAWGDDKQKRLVLDGLSVGDEFSGIVTRVDVEGRRVFISRRRLTENPGECFLRDHRDKVLSAVVVSIENVGAHVRLENTDIPAFLPRSEMEWSYCGDPHACVSVDERLQVKLINYHSYHENLIVSRKRVFDNHFAEFQDMYKPGDPVIGVVRAILDDRVLLVVGFGEGRQVMAYIHKAEVSNIAFIEDDMLSRMFSVGDEYHTTVKAMYPRFENVELTRKKVLHSAAGRIQYGDEHDVKCVAQIRSGLFVYCDEVEGVLVGAHVSPGNELIRVIPARIDPSRQKIEFHVV